jgi:adenylosuccinate synthase
MSAKVVLIAGLGYGDEGKGSTVDWLARTKTATTLVVRYNGGAQAAHNVVAGDQHHTFAQFGSATLAGVPTLLSRHVLVNPISLFAEARHLAEIGVRDPLSRVCVEGGALVTTPYHVAMNRLREMARTGRHGSCGMGIGETMQDSLSDPSALRVGMLADVALVRRKLGSLRDAKLAEARSFVLPLSEGAARELAVLEDPDTIARTLEAYAAFVDRVAIVDPSFLRRALDADGRILFEGAQGVLLDQDFGFQPHTTWTNITFDNAHDLLGGFAGDVTRLGILRAYATRHGAGPFVTEDRAMSVLSDHDHNQTGEWQGVFRSGAADLVATRYALEILGPIDGLVITNLDRLPEARESRIPIAVAYDGAPDPRFFDGPGRRVERIVLRRPFDLAHQEALTRALADVRPILERIETAEPRGLMTYAETLADRLALPLVAASFGPTADDKIALPPLRPAGLRTSIGAIAT